MRNNKDIRLLSASNLELSVLVNESPINGDGTLFNAKPQMNERSNTNAYS